MLNTKPAEGRLSPPKMCPSRPRVTQFYSRPKPTYKYQKTYVGSWGGGVLIKATPVTRVAARLSALMSPRGSEILPVYTPLTACGVEIFCQPWVDGGGGSSVVRGCVKAQRRSAWLSARVRLRVCANTIAAHMQCVNPLSNKSSERPFHVVILIFHFD